MSKPSPTGHPSFGRVPPSAFKEAMNAPAIDCHTILRKYVPDFGIAKGDVVGPVRKYRVHVTRSMSGYEEAIISVDAKSQEEATGIVSAMSERDFNWRDQGDYSPDGGFEVENVEEES